ncbi:beta-N-acetylhexosaminidase [Microbacterium sp.]|uniref:beta-N-acetylhexosaminidase n=1 Tax=Microbacterium sp. TaxID=51671 RepID=UPI003A86E358
MTTLIPRPRRLLSGAGRFTLSSRTRLVAPTALIAAAIRLQESLRAPTGFPLPIVEATAGPDDILLHHNPALAPEEYRLAVADTGVRIDASCSRGAGWAGQTLLQLFPAAVYRRARVDADWSAPAVAISDAPRFGWRGAMLDVARHFRTPAELRRFIDQLAMHRLNVLHLHLTDDQGWRIQIHRYPRLTEVGAWRSASQIGTHPDAFTTEPHGGYYTQDELRELVAYAAERGITIVPEIDLPGHSQAAIAAYPSLGVIGEPMEPWTRWGINPNALAMTDDTVAFFCHVLDEVIDIFPSPHIGIGGDECVKTQWHDDDATQARMRALGLDDEEQLQNWFIARLGEHLTRRGRILYGWDEILEGGGAPGHAVVASWRGTVGAVSAARAGHEVVLCPDDSVYLDYRQSDAPDEPIPVGTVLTVADVYAFEPIPDALTEDEAALVLGGQANLWTEHIDSVRRLDYMAFPRLCAVAEVLWSGPERDAADFAARLQTHLARLDAAGIEYRPADGPLPWQRRPGIPGRPQTRGEREVEMARLTENIR